MKGFLEVSLCLILCSASPVPSWQRLHRLAQPVRVFDNAVLGGIANVTEVARLRVPRSHTLMADISVGTPPQPLRCLLDTGFSDIWLPWDSCEGCAHKRHFRSGRSSTFVPAAAATAREGLSQWEPVQLPHAHGIVSGFLGRDTINFGERMFNNQSFFLVGEANLPQQRDWDGVCGLGMHQIATGGRPLFRRIAASSRGGQGIFALVPGTVEQPYLVTGGVPHEACKEGTLRWLEVAPLRPGAPRSFWAFSGGLAIHRRLPVPSLFVLDSGTSFMLAPPGKFIAFVQSLFLMDTFSRLCGLDAAAGNLVVCHCSLAEAEGLLPLRVYLGGRPFSIEIWELFKRVPAGDGGELCLLQIQQNPVSALDPLDLLGDLMRDRPAEAGGTGGPAASRTLLSNHPRVPEGRMSDDALDSGDERVEDGLDGILQARRLQAAQPVWDGPSTEDLDENLWVLGGVFLERFVSILDFESGRIGFAEPVQVDLPPAKVQNPPVLPMIKSSGRLGEGPGVSQQLASEVHTDGSPPKGLNAEVQVLEAENAALRNDLAAIYRRSETEASLADRMGQWTSLRGDLRELKEQNRELRTKIRALEHSYQQSENQYREFKQESAAQHTSQWHYLTEEMRSLETKNAALRRSNVVLIVENRDLRVSETRLQVTLTLACFATVVLAICTAMGACKAIKHRLWSGLRKGSTRADTRDVAPLLSTALRGSSASPAHSPSSRPPKAQALEPEVEVE
mmetsp:Transcript_71254/g.201976  ORF Transcript_71254/g.201976 Transcript_71254/m.201976 type:complete len:734 (-) Transcript_71254:495-2696(-)